MTIHNTIQPHIFPPTWVLCISASEKLKLHFSSWSLGEAARRGITAACVLAMETISCDISKSNKPNREGYPCPSRLWRRSMCYLWPSASARETSYTYCLLSWYPTQGKIGQKLHFLLSVLYSCLAGECRSPVLCPLTFVQGFLCASGGSDRAGTFMRATENKYVQSSLSCKNFPLVHLSGNDKMM